MYEELPGTWIFHFFGFFGFLFGFSNFLHHFRNLNKSQLILSVCLFVDNVARPKIVADFMIGIYLLQLPIGDENCHKSPTHGPTAGTKHNTSCKFLYRNLNIISDQRKYFFFQK